VLRVRGGKTSESNKVTCVDSQGINRNDETRPSEFVFQYRGSTEEAVELYGCTFVIYRDLEGSRRSKFSKRRRIFDSATKMLM
jgi:hypothetical protein